MAARIARLEQVARRFEPFKATRLDRWRRIGLVVVSVLVRRRPVMVLRVIVVSGVVDVQRRGRGRRSHQSKNEEDSQGTSQRRESMRRQLTGQTQAQRSPRT
jgi:hypothetical protein